MLPPYVLPTTTGVGTSRESRPRDIRSNHIDIPPSTGHSVTRGFTVPIRPPPEPKAPSDRRALEKLTRLYSRTKGLEYSGSQDHLDVKLRIFVDLCQQALVEPEFWHQALQLLER